MKKVFLVLLVICVIGCKPKKALETTVLIHRDEVFISHIIKPCKHDEGWWGCCVYGCDCLWCVKCGEQIQ